MQNGDKVKIVKDLKLRGKKAGDEKPHPHAGKTGVLAVLDLKGNSAEVLLEGETETFNVEADQVEKA